MLSIITFIISFIACTTPAIKSENIKIASIPVTYARINTPIANSQTQLDVNVIALVDEVEIEWLPTAKVYMLTEEVEYEYIPAQ